MIRFKSYMFVKVIAFVLIVTFIAFDISWAYPPGDSSQNQNLATWSNFQQSVFVNDAGNAMVIQSIADNLFGNPEKDGQRFPLRNLAGIVAADLGKMSEKTPEIMRALETIDVSSVTTAKWDGGKFVEEELEKDRFISADAILLVPYKRGGKDRIIQIALKGSSNADALIGEEASFFLGNKFVARDVPRDWFGPAVVKTKGGNAPAKISGAGAPGQSHDFTAESGYNAAVTTGVISILSFVGAGLAYFSRNDFIGFAIAAILSGLYFGWSAMRYRNMGKAALDALMKSGLTRSGAMTTVIARSDGYRHPAYAENRFITLHEGFAEHLTGMRRVMPIISWFFRDKYQESLRKVDMHVKVNSGDPESIFTAARAGFKDIREKAFDNINALNDAKKVARVLELSFDLDGEIKRKTLKILFNMKTVESLNELRGAVARSLQIGGDVIPADIAAKLCGQISEDGDADILTGLLMAYVDDARRPIYDFSRLEALVQDPVKLNKIFEDARVMRQLDALRRYVGRSLRFKGESVPFEIASALAAQMLSRRDSAIVEMILDQFVEMKDRMELREVQEEGAALRTDSIEHSSSNKVIENVKVGEEADFSKLAALVNNSEELKRIFDEERLELKVQFEPQPQKTSTLHDSMGSQLHKEYGPYAHSKWLYHSDRVDELLKGNFNDVIPVTAEFVPSLKCNYMCPTCTYGKAKKGFEGVYHTGLSDDGIAVDSANIENVEAGVDKANEKFAESHSKHEVMGWETMKASLDKLKEAGLKAIIFTGGGEPLTNPDTIKGIRYAKGLGLKVALYTNGSLLTESRIKELIDISPDFIRISIDAGTESTFNLTHGLPEGAKIFGRVLENLEMLAREKLARGSKTTIGVGVIINPLTAKEVDKTIEVVKAASIRAGGGIDYIAFRPTVNYVGGNQYSEATKRILRRLKDSDPKSYGMYLNFFIGGSQFPEVVFDLAQENIEKAGERVRIGGEEKLVVPGTEVALLSIKSKLRDVTKPKSYHVCLAHSWFTEIWANGDVFLCSELNGNPEYRLGSLRDQTFKEIWESDRRKEVLRSIDINKKCPPVCKLHEYNQIFQSIQQAIDEGRVGEERAKIEAERANPEPTHVNYLSVDPFAAMLATAAIGSIFSSVKDFILTYPIFTGAAALGIGIVLFLIIRHVFFLVNRNIQMLGSSDSNTRCAAVIALSKVKDPRIEELLTKMLNDADPAVCLTVARTMAVTNHRATEALLGMLKNKDEHNYAEAISVLGMRKDPEATKSILEILENEENSERRILIMQALGDIGDPAASDALIKILTDKTEVLSKSLAESKSARERNAAVIALGKIKEGRAKKALVATLLDEYDWVSRSAVNVLDEMGWKPEDRAEEIRYGIAKRDWTRIVDIGNEAIPIMVAIVSNRNYSPVLRTNVIDTLGMIGGNLSEKALRAIKTSDESHGIREAVAGSLRLSSEKLVKQLEPGATHDFTAKSGYEAATATSVISIISFALAAYQYIYKYDTTGITIAVMSGIYFGWATMRYYGMAESASDALTNSGLNRNLASYTTIARNDGYRHPAYVENKFITLHEGFLNHGAGMFAVLPIISLFFGREFERSRLKAERYIKSDEGAVKPQPYDLYGPNILKTISRIAKLSIVPAAAITASYFFGGAYAALFVSSFWKALFVATIIGGITLGSGSFMEQTARGEPINWNKILRWGAVGAVLLGPITYGLWFQFLDYLKISPLLFTLLDLCLYAPLVFIPIEFFAQKYFISKGAPTTGILNTMKSHAFISTLNIFWFGPLIYLGRTFYPDWIVLIDANAGIIWAGIAVYLLESWKRVAGRSQAEKEDVSVEKPVIDMPVTEEAVSEYPNKTIMASAQSETTEAEKVRQLFEIVEAKLNNNRARVANAANEIAAYIVEYGGTPFMSDSLLANEDRTTIEMKDEMAQILAAADDVMLPENLSSAAQEVKEGLKQLDADSIVTNLIVMARRVSELNRKGSKNESQKLIVGISTDWIPTYSVKRSLQHQAMNGLVNKIKALPAALRSMGLDNLELVIEDQSSALASNVSKMAKDSNTRLSNIVVIASRDSVENGVFDGLRNETGGEMAFLAGMDSTVLEGLNKNSGILTSEQVDVDIMEILALTLEVATGKEPPSKLLAAPYNSAKRILILSPSATIKDYQLLREVNEGRKQALESA